MMIIAVNFLAKIVPECDPTTTCGEAKLIELITNVINFMLVNLAAPLAVLFFLWGGFLLLTSGGSSNQVERGKKAITAAVIGLVIILSSIVIIHTFFDFFVNKEVCTSKLLQNKQLWEVKCPGAVKQTQ